MTKVIYKLRKNFISYIIIKDHANFAEKNYDIVCSAISAITNGTVNFLHENYRRNCKVIQFSSKIIIDSLKEEEVKYQLCLELMLYQLKNVAKYYPEYLEIIEEKY